MRRENLKCERAYKIKSTNNVTALVALWKAKLEKIYQRNMNFYVPI